MAAVKVMLEPRPPQASSLEATSAPVGPARRSQVSPVKVAPVRPQVPSVIFWPAVSATTWFTVFCCALLVLVAL